MKIPATKDILFVSVQFLLFIIYFIPFRIITFQLIYFIKYFALFIALIGLLVIALAILQLNKNLTPFPSPKENGTLIQTGLYKFVRHPIYSGITLSTIGLGFFYGSISKISIGIILWVLFFFKSKYEETLLSKHFTEYEAYTKTSNRFFPFSLKGFSFDRIND